MSRNTRSLNKHTPDLIFKVYMYVRLYTVHIEKQTSYRLSVVHTWVVRNTCKLEHKLTCRHQREWWKRTPLCYTASGPQPSYWDGSNTMKPRTRTPLKKHTHMQTRNSDLFLKFFHCVYSWLTCVLYVPTKSLWPVASRLFRLISSNANSTDKDENKLFVFKDILFLTKLDTIEI